MTAYYSTWTEERTAKCLRLWTEGLSGTQVARELGGCTRNAVIGKVYRAGLMGRAKPSRPGAPPREPKPIRAAQPKPTPKPRPVREPNPVRDAPDLAEHQIFALMPTAIPLIGRPFGSCAWPVGQPERPADQLCCGAKRTPGRPYCAEHAKAGQMKNGYGLYEPGLKPLLHMLRKVA